VSLWPDLLRVTLCPDQVVLERGKLAISLKGVEPRYFDPEVIPVEPRHEPTLWAAPLAVLGIALDGLPERPHEASVLLSNHFSHYPLIHGDSCPGLETVASHDHELENALRDLLGRHNCHLTCLQSRLVAFGSSLLDELQGESGWIVLVEEGLASIGLVQDGEFTRFRNLYMWPASSVEILALLDHEALLAGHKVPPRNLLLWRRDESDEVILPLNSGWQVTRLGDHSTNAVPLKTTTGSLSLDSVRA